MYRNYRVEAFIPAGRKKTMDILIKYLKMNSDIIDKVQVWYNPHHEDKTNQAWLKTLDSEFLEVKYLPEHYKHIKQPLQFNTGRFYEYTTDPNTIYIRFDDDVIYMHEDAIKNLLDFRIDNPQYLVTFATIWNNAVVSYLEQQEGKITTGDYEMWTINTPYCMDEIGWGNGDFAVHIHEQLLEAIDKEEVDRLYVVGKDTKGDMYTNKLRHVRGGYELLDSNRFSISCFAFFGKDWAEIDGKFPEPEAGKMDEEIYIAEIWPEESNRMNAICGNAIVSHYTFSPYQKPVVERTDILDRYRELANKKFEKEYYKLISQTQPGDGKY